MAATLGALGCGHHLPSPPLAVGANAAPAPETLIDVSSAPPAAHVEFIPPSPRDDAVWIDGQWTYEGRWRWDPGGWLIAPKGASFAPWRALRRSDGSLVLAPAAWRDAHGNALDAPPFLVRATPGHTAQEPETRPLEGQPKPPGDPKPPADEDKGQRTPTEDEGQRTPTEDPRSPR